MQARSEHWRLPNGNMNETQYRICLADQADFRIQYPNGLPAPPPSPEAQAANSLAMAQIGVALMAANAPPPAPLQPMTFPAPAAGIYSVPRY